MRKLKENIKKSCKKSDLYLNVEKTKLMSNQPLQHFTIGTENVEVVQKFILLGSVVENEEDCRKESARRLTLGRAAARGLEKIWRDLCMAKSLRLTQ